MEPDGPPNQNTRLPHTAPWWTRAVIYQIYPRSFADSDGDGVGDLQGIMAHLDYLSLLGVDAIWLSPVYPSPQVDNGYDVSDYQGVDRVFGGLNDLDLLVAKLHARGIKLIMDIVANHTSDQHPWFQASRSSRHDAKRSWYIWSDPREGQRAGEPGAEPTNWESYFGGPAWTLDEHTGQYYLHLFAPEQPDLNWDCEDVRESVYEMMRWWVARGVDGFRMDVVNFISKRSDRADGPRLGTARYGDGKAFWVAGPHVHQYLAEMRAKVVGEKKEFLIIGEMPHVSVSDARLFTDPVRKELDMVFQFEHVEVDRGLLHLDSTEYKMKDLKDSLHRWQRGLGSVGWNSLYWNNHDQARAVSHFGDDREYRAESAKALGTVLHLHRGTPFVFQGEELGMTNVDFRSINQFRCISGIQRYREALRDGRSEEWALEALRKCGRDNGRTPMQWDTSPNAGFSTAEPWIPVNGNYEVVNARAAVDDPDSVFHHYRRLIQLRHTEPVVSLGDFTMVLSEHEQVYAFIRKLGDVEMLVIANLSGAQVEADVPGGESWLGEELVLATGCRDRERFVLEPWESRVYRRTAEGA